MKATTSWRTIFNGDLYDLDTAQRAELLSLSCLIDKNNLLY